MSHFIDIAIATKTNKQKRVALFVVIFSPKETALKAVERDIMAASKKKIQDKIKEEIKQECKKAKNALIEKFWKQVDEMLKAHCYGTEIASFLGISADCLYERCRKQKRMDWSVYSQTKMETGKVLLRMSQFSKAVKEKNVQMQIHLGKNLLNQTDRQIIQTEEIKSQKAILRLPDNGRRIINQVEKDEK